MDKFKSLLFLFLILFLASCSTPSLPTVLESEQEDLSNQPLEFDGKNAYQFVKDQVDFGLRIPGSDAHHKTEEMIMDHLKKTGWKIEVQVIPHAEYELKNIIGTRISTEYSPWIIVGAHYDSRFFADNDPDPGLHAQPVPGANDGASGVAILLELARVLPENFPKNVSLVFFDGEDQGRIPGWDWILGSYGYSESLTSKPDGVVILDMLGDQDLNIYYEINSNAEIQQEIWKIAAELGYSNQFIAEYKYRILDDHIPFIEKGISAIDIIDFDYPYWHTTQDTLDKISPESLEIVGKTIYHWLLVP